MTFSEAVDIVKDYAEGYDLGRNLLSGLEMIKQELAHCEVNEDAEYFVTPEQVMAYHIVCREMRKLFV